MTIRITLVRRAHAGQDGKESPATTIIREFDDQDEARAVNWFVQDSYFSEGYTQRATFERIEGEPGYIRVQREGW